MSDATPDTPTAPPENLCLYCLMRSQADLPSLNPGKAIAQGIHSGNKFTYDLTEGDRYADKPAEWKTLWTGRLAAWKNQARGQGFGTTLTKEATLSDIRRILRAADAFGVPAGLVLDESYPWLVEAETAALLWESSARIMGLPPGTPMRPNAEGKVLLVRPEYSCAYLFGVKEELDTMLLRFGLYP